MLELLRRNNKKILAVVGVFLMIAFVAERMRTSAW